MKQISWSGGEAVLLHVKSLQVKVTEQDSYTTTTLSVVLCHIRLLHLAYPQRNTSLLQYLSTGGVNLHWPHDPIGLRFPLLMSHDSPRCMDSAILNITAHGYFQAAGREMNLNCLFYQKKGLQTQHLFNTAIRVTHLSTKPEASVHPQHITWCLYHPKMFFT